MSQEQEPRSIFGTIWARKGVVLIAGILVLAAGLLYTFLTPAVWEAKATIIFPVRATSILGSGNFDQAGLSSALTGGPTPLRVFAGMLESERALQFVAKESGISRRRVLDMRSFMDQTMESTISIIARDRDPELAKKVVSLHLDALKRINRDMNEPLASNDGDALKVRLDRQEQRVLAAEQRLLAFQKGAITAPTVASTGSARDAGAIPSTARWSEQLRQLEVQYRRVDSSIRDALRRTKRVAQGGQTPPAHLPPVQKWREKLIDLEYELRIKGLSLAPGAYEIVKLRKAIDITRRQLKSEVDKYASAAEMGMVDPSRSGDEKLPSMVSERVGLEAQIEAVRRLAELAPAESIELTRLTREYASQGQILQELQRQYEQASLQESRDPNRWQLLDEPYVEDKPVNKSLMRNGLVFAFLGLAIGCLAALVWPQRRSGSVLGMTDDREDRIRAV